MSDNTFNPFGDNDFHAAQKTFQDAWTRLSQTMSPEAKQSSTANVNDALTQAMDYWNKTSNPFGDTDFLSAQKTFLDAWAQLSQTMSPEAKQSSTASVTDAWSKAMEYWGQSQSSTGMMPNEIQHVYTKLIEQAKVYNMFSEQMSGFMKTYNELDKTSSDWQQQLESCINGMESFFSEHGTDATNTIKQMQNVWQQMSTETRQNPFSSASMMPDDFLQQFNSDSLQSAAEKYLSMPGIGYTRESQEQHLKSIKLWGEYQKASNEFNSANSRVNTKALEGLKKKIFKLAEEDKNISSLREIYDLWVDANEDAYAEFVYSEEYTQLYSAMVNSLMAFKQHNQKFVDKSLSEMNIPTQKGMDTVKQRLQEVRRELFDMRNKFKVDQQQIKQLHKEVADLRKEVKVLKTDTNTKLTSQVKKTSKRKVSSRKSAVAKPKEKIVKKAARKKAAVKSVSTTKAKKTRAQSVRRKKAPADSGMMVIKI